MSKIINQNSFKVSFNNKNYDLHQVPKTIAQLRKDIQNKVPNIGQINDIEIQYKDQENEFVELVTDEALQFLIENSQSQQKIPKIFLQIVQPQVNPSNNMYQSKRMENKSQSYQFQQMQPLQQRQSIQRQDKPDQIFDQEMTYSLNVSEPFNMNMVQSRELVIKNKITNSYQPPTDQIVPEQEQDSLISKTSKHINEFSDIDCYKCQGKQKIESKDPEQQTIDCKKCKGSGKLINTPELIMLQKLVDNELIARFPDIINVLPNYKGLAAGQESQPNNMVKGQQPQSINNGRLKASQQLFTNANQQENKLLNQPFKINDSNPFPELFQSEQCIPSGRTTIVNNRKINQQNICKLCNTAQSGQFFKCQQCPEYIVCDKCRINCKHNHELIQLKSTIKEEKQSSLSNINDFAQISNADVQQYQNQTHNQRNNVQPSTTPQVKQDDNSNQIIISKSCSSDEREEDKINQDSQVQLSNPPNLQLHSSNKSNSIEYKTKYLTEPDMPIKGVLKGQNFYPNYQIQNSGATQWPENCYFRCISGVFKDYKVKMLSLPSKEECFVNLNLKVPENPDKYICSWRMCYEKNDGTMINFGARATMQLIVE